MNESLAQQLEMLFSEAGSAHHQAFIHVNGEDADWAIWYANYVREPIGRLLKRTFDPQQLAVRLEQIEANRKTLAIGNWQRHYAEALLHQSSSMS